MALVEKAGVMVTPGAFGPSGEGYVRLALVQDEEMLNKAIRAVDASGILKAWGKISLGRCGGGRGGRKR